MSDDRAGDAAVDLQDESGSQVQLWKPRSDDTATWLYDLVFSSRTESEDVPGSKASSTAESNGPDESTTNMSTNGGVVESTAHSTAIVAQESDKTHLQALMQKPVQTSSVVNELLAEWTTLTEEEIEDIAMDRPKKRTAGEEATEAQERETKTKQAPVLFKDAVGRKFSFPFHLVRTWSVGPSTSSTSKPRLRGRAC